MILWALAVAAFVVPTAVIRAQSTATTDPAVAEPVLSAPQIYVNNLVLDKTTVQQGAVVTGHADFINRGNAASSDIYYDVILDGNFVNRVPQAMYDSIRQGPVSLDIGESKRVNFSYALPVGFAGADMGVRLQAVLKSGIHMGWSDAHLIVNGTSTILKAGSASLVVDGKSYLPDSGPTVSTGNSVAYNVTLTNPLKSDITVLPHVQVYRYGAGNVIVSDTKGDAVTIPAGKSVQTSVSLPDLNGNSGVYYGNLSFVDNGNSQKSQDMTFRYIIAGNIVTIQSVSADQTSAVTGDTVNVTVTYTGAPVNIDDGQHVANGMVNMTVTAFDAEGHQVGQAAGEVDASKPVQASLIAVPITANANALRFDVKVQMGSSILSQYSGNILTASNRSVLPLTAKSKMALYLAMAISLVAILLGVILIRKSKKDKNSPPIIGLQGALLLTVAFFGLSILRLGVLNAFVMQSTTFVNYGDYSSEYPLFINFPYDNQSMVPGQQFYLEGMAIFSECDNIDYAAQHVSVTYNGNYNDFIVGPITPSTASSSEYSIISQVNDIFSLGPFTAPASNGNYRMNITFTAPNSFRGVPSTPAETGYINTVVSGGSGWSGTSSFISKSASNPPCGGFIALTWYNVSGATEYQLYRDSDPLPIYDGSLLSYTDQVPGFTTHTYYVVALINNVPQAPSNIISLRSTDYCQLSVQYFWGAPSPVVLGQSMVWIAQAVGGSGVYSFTWAGDDYLSQAPGTVIPSGMAIHKSYTTLGTKGAGVDVTSSDGQHASANSSIQVQASNGYSAIQCYATPSDALVNHPVTWTVSTDLSNPSSYTYNWLGSDGLSISTTSQSIQFTYKSPGLKHVQVDIVGIGSNPDCIGDAYLRWNSQFQEL